MPTIKKNKNRWFVKKSTTGNQQGRKEKSKQYNTTAWKNFKLRVLIRDKYLCQECLRNNIYTKLCEKKWDHAVDHIIEVRAGGNFFDMDNAESLCASCHNRKSGRKSKGVGQS